MTVLYRHEASAENQGGRPDTDWKTAAYVLFETFCPFTWPIIKKADLLGLGLTETNTEQLVYQTRI